MLPNQAPNHHHQQQQLQPYGSGSGSNSSQSSPFKRVPQAASPLASPMESRRVFMSSMQQTKNLAEHPMPSSQQQPQHSINYSPVQLGYALPTCRLLVDPQTGQQYFVPTAPAPQTFPPAAPAPTPFLQPTALFYNQPSTPAAYYPTVPPHHLHKAHSKTSDILCTPYHAHQQSSIISSTGYNTHQLSQQQQQQQITHLSQAFPSNVASFSASTNTAHRSQSPTDRYQENAITPATAPYCVEIPPSTVGSTYGDGYMDEQQQQQYFHCRHSTDSKGSYCSSSHGYFVDGKQQMVETHSNPEEFYYCSNSPVHQQKTTSFNHGIENQPINQSISVGGSSSESTSGFASAGRSRTRTIGDEPRSPQLPQSPYKEQRMSTTFQNIKPHQQINEERSIQNHAVTSPTKRRKAIRMDIDLNRPVSPLDNQQGATARQLTTTIGKQRNGAEENSSVSVRVLRTAPPTAFTISFNDNVSELGQVSISELSLQEAALQAPKGKQLMLARRVISAKEKNKHSSNEVAPDSGSECGDPKRWLFRKMMMGREGRSKSTDGGNPDEQQQQDHEDLASEAGTYVVESNNNNSVNNATMTNSQLSSSQATTKEHKITSKSNFNASSSSSSVSSSSRTSSDGRTPSPSVAKKKSQQLQPIIRPNIAITDSQAAKRSLMNDLRLLRENGGGNNQKTNTAFSTSQQKPKASVLQKLPLQSQSSSNAADASSSTANRLCRLKPEPQEQQNYFRRNNCRCHSEPRNDGGRFSMRPTGGGRVLPTVIARKELGPPPIVLSTTKIVKKVKQPAQQQQSPEMKAWLRRKEYDPRKAVAINQQQQQQLEREQLLKAQEAFIANRSLSAAPSTASTVTKPSPFARWRDQQTTRGAAITSERPVNVNRSHGDLSRVGGESMDEESLLGANDSCSSNLQRTVDELTQKCHKSIALLKICNPSSQQFLEGVLGAAPVENENISDRLERMGSAFDAIQKYLEEQTTVGKTFRTNETGYAAGGGDNTSYLNTGTYRKKNSTFALAKFVEATNNEVTKMAVVNRNMQDSKLKPAQVKEE